MPMPLGTFEPGNAERCDCKSRTAARGAVGYSGRADARMDFNEHGGGDGRALHAF